MGKKIANFSTIAFWLLLFHYIANFCVSAFWLLAFRYFGGITIDAEMSIWWTIAIIVFVALVVEACLDILGVTLLKNVPLAGCLLVLLFYFAQGWLYLLGAQKITELFVLNVGFWSWGGFLMSVCFGLLRIPSVTLTTSSPMRRRRFLLDDGSLS